MNNIPHDESLVKEETKFSQLSWRLLGQLNYLQKYFKTKGKLRADGSFGQSNKQLYKFLKCSLRGLMKARKPLCTAGKIKFSAGAVNGTRSRYWVLASPQGKPKTNLEFLSKLPPIHLNVLSYNLKLNDKEVVKKDYLGQGYTEAEFEGAFERLKH